ncbi:MAG: ABC transporter permease [Vicinamibacterales bacterium]
MTMDGLRHDLIGAWRGLVRTPGVSVAAVLTLALGLGATSALFAVVKAVVLAPLPYDRPDTRVLLWSRWVNFDKTWLSDQEVLDYRRDATTLRDIAAWDTTPVNVTGDGEPVRLVAGRVTANTFTTLGTRPLLGRDFTAADDVPERPPRSSCSGTRCGRRATAATPASSAGGCRSTTRLWKSWA